MKTQPFTNMKHNAMKHETHELPVRRKTKKIPGAAGRWILAGLIGCLAWSATAAVQTVRFDPPLVINSFSEESSDGILPSIFGVDFNTDGDADFRLLYGFGGIEAYFNNPTRVGCKAGQSGTPLIGGSVAAVPLCSIIGGDIVSSVTTNRYVWAPGYTNRDDLTQPLGDHEASVLSAYWIGFTVPGTIGGGISIIGNTIVTNYTPPPPQPVVTGDIAGKEGVMALEFNVNGQPRYGYIHFDFRPETTTPIANAADVTGVFCKAVGVIYGWAYETEPGMPIEAVSLAPDTETIDHQRHHPPSRNPQRWR
jgi:hypothetical protein